MGVDDLAKPPITARKLLYQALLDWTGKEVQTGYTYTYVWMANQLGHFTLGFLPSALSFWLVDVIAGGLRQNRPWLLQFGLPLAIAVLLGLFWLWKEIDDIRRCTATAASSYFAASFDRTSVFLDAATAVGFIWIGIAVGDIGYWWPRWAIAALLAGAVIALAPAGTGCASVSVSSSPDCRWCTGSPSFRAASIRPASPRCARCAPARPGTWPSLAASAPARARCDRHWHRARLRPLHRARPVAVQADADRRGRGTAGAGGRDRLAVAHCRDPHHRRRRHRPRSAAHRPAWPPGKAPNTVWILGAEPDGAVAWLAALRDFLKAPIAVVHLQGKLAATVDPAQRRAGRRD